MTNATITISYTTSVKTPAGWRSTNCTAEAVKVSAGMAEVTKVLLIDGEEPNYGQSITGAKRQSFNGKYWAGTQIGAKKRLSACKIVA